jgi:hypothetical protein
VKCIRAQVEEGDRIAFTATVTFHSSVGGYTSDVSLLIKLDPISMKKGAMEYPTYENMKKGIGQFIYVVDVTIRKVWLSLDEDLAADLNKIMFPDSPAVLYVDDETDAKLDEYVRDSGGILNGGFWRMLYQRRDDYDTRLRRYCAGQPVGAIPGSHCTALRISRPLHST